MFSVIAVEGSYSSGAQNVGKEIAEQLHIDFVDRLILADVAKRVGATFNVVAEHEKKVPSLTSRLAKTVTQMFLKSTAAGMIDEPYFGTSVANLISKPYYQMEENAPINRASELNEKYFIATTAEVIKDIAASTDVVIVGRGCAAILKPMKHVLRVGTVADDETRLKNVQKEQKVSAEQAREYIRHADIAQSRYFKKAFNTHVLNPLLYHIMWNLSDTNVKQAATATVSLYKKLSSKGI